MPVVLLGSCLGIRSDKPISHHTHFPLFPFGDLIPAGACGQEENPTSVSTQMSLKIFLLSLSLSVGSYREPSD